MLASQRPKLNTDAIEFSFLPRFSAREEVRGWTNTPAINEDSVRIKKRSVGEVSLVHKEEANFQVIKQTLVPQLEHEPDLHSSLQTLSFERHKKRLSSKRIPT